MKVTGIARDRFLAAAKLEWPQALLPWVLFRQGNLQGSPVDPQPLQLWLCTHWPRAHVCAGRKCQPGAEIWSLWMVQQWKKNMKKSYRSRTKLLGMGRSKKSPKCQWWKCSAAVSSARDVQSMIPWLEREQRSWVRAGCCGILQWEKLSWAQVSLRMLTHYMGVYYFMRK